MTSSGLLLKNACCAGDVEEARRLLDLGTDPNSTDEYGSGTLLSFHPEVLELLIDRGADPDIQTNENGASVLAGLCYVNQLECVRILLQRGADPNRGREESGETPLHHALASRDGDREGVVSLLLDHGADPNAHTKPGILSLNFWREARTRGETPLHRAAAFAPVDTLLRLLAAGADPTLADAHGDTPLAWASWHLRDWDIIQLLSR